MHVREETYIFHLARADGRSLVLHPLRAAKILLPSMEQGEVSGRFGAEPRIEALRVLRVELYRLIEAAVRRARAEARFIPTFIVSAAVFLASYFLFSYLLPDPLPMFDELCIALAVAAVTYLLLARRDDRSGIASGRRRALTARADRIHFTESGFLIKAERLLHDWESRGIEDVLREIGTPPLLEIGEDEAEEAVQLLPLLEACFEPRKLKREERLIRRHGSNPENLLERMRFHRVDFPLLALYRSLKRSMGEHVNRGIPMSVDSAGFPAGRDP